MRYSRMEFGFLRVWLTVVIVALGQFHRPEGLRVSCRASFVASKTRYARCARYVDDEKNFA